MATYKLPLWSSAKFFYALRVDPQDAQVLVSLTDHTPLLLEKRLGEGRVLLLASGLEGLTNDLPLQPAFVAISSQLAHKGAADMAHYAAAKAGVLGFTRSLAYEVARDGITVNAISPGPFATEMNTTLIQNPELNQQFLSKIPLGRWGRVEEVGRLALHLCSEHSGFITGTDILIDGGWTAQ